MLSANFFSSLLLLRSLVVGGDIKLSCKIYHSYKGLHLLSQLGSGPVFNSIHLSELWLNVGVYQFIAQIKCFHNLHITLRHIYMQGDQINYPQAVFTVLFLLLSIWGCSLDNVFKVFVLGSNFILKAKLCKMQIIPCVGSCWYPNASQVVILSNHCSYLC